MPISTTSAMRCPGNLTKWRHQPHAMRASPAQLPKLLLRESTSNSYTHRTSMTHGRDISTLAVLAKCIHSLGCRDGPLAEP
eukprot:755277-Amphidinium_carterae.1